MSINNDYGQHAAGAADEFAIAQWGQVQENQTVVCPSGQKVLVKTLEMEEIVSLGLINELDTFTGMFDDAESESAQSGDDLDFLKRITEGGKFENFMGTLDKVIMAATVKPVVIGRVPADEVAGYLAKGQVPINKISMADKMAIFSVGFQGLGDMADFREGPGDGVAAVAAEPITEVPSL